MGSAESWRLLRRDGVRLACRDFGGSGPAVLLLHGLAGHAGEWAQTASWLTARCRVVALDARGHGRSERLPGDVSRGAQIADAAWALDRLDLAPAVVVGQSLGGLTALGLAAARPQLVRGLVVVDAGASGGALEADAAARAAGRALRQWPVPFASRSAALAFFGERFGGRTAAVAWADGLEERDDGWWPRFDVGVMVRTIRAAVAEPGWDAWERAACPALLVRSGAGVVAPELAREMVRRRAGARLVELECAAHDVHLDRPQAWRRTLSGFLESLDAQP